MLKAYEVMTHSLATCGPDASVTQVAETMRTRDIGNVLVVEDGKLCGIVTDRDLALQALTGKDDPLQTPIRKFMSTKLITGEVDWNLEQMAKVMARHQIRRLPIVQNGQVVGIVTLGDVSRLDVSKEVVTKSLQAISTPNDLPNPARSKHAGVLLGLALTTLATTLMAWFTWNHTGQALLKQVAKSDFAHSARQLQSAALATFHEAASSKSARGLRKQMRSNLRDISAQLPTLEYKAPKHKPIWVN